MQSYPDLDTFRLTNAKLPGFIDSGYLSRDSVTLLYETGVMLTSVLQCSIVSCYRGSGSVRVQRYRDAGESLDTGVRGPRSHGDRETGWRVAGGGDFCELGKWVLSQNQITKYS